MAGRGGASKDTSGFGLGSRLGKVVEQIGIRTKNSVLWFSLHFQVEMERSSCRWKCQDNRVGHGSMDGRRSLRGPGDRWTEETPGLSNLLAVPFCWTLFSLFKKDFIYLFIHEEGGQRHRQREKQVPRMEPNAGLDPGSPGSRPGPQVVLNL